MLLTGAASASSPTGLMTVHNDVMTVHNDVDPGSRPARHCVITASANEAAPDSGLAVPAGDVGGPIGSVDMAPGFT